MLLACAELKQGLIISTYNNIYYCLFILSSLMFLLITDLHSSLKTVCTVNNFLLDRTSLFFFSGTESGLTHFFAFKHVS